MSRKQSRARKARRRMTQSEAQGRADTLPSVAGPVAADGPVAGLPAADPEPDTRGLRGALHLMDRALRRNTFVLPEKCLADTPAVLHGFVMDERIKRRLRISASSVLVRMANHNHREETAGLLPGEQRPQEPVQQTVVIQGDVNVQQNNESPQLTDAERLALLARLSGEYGRNGDSR